MGIRQAHYYLFVAVLLWSSQGLAGEEPMNSGLWLEFFHGEKMGLGESHDYLAESLREGVAQLEVLCLDSLEGKDVQVGPNRGRLVGRTRAKAVGLSAKKGLRRSESCKNRPVVVGPLFSLETCEQLDSRWANYHTYSTPVLVGYIAPIHEFEEKFAKAGGLPTEDEAVEAIIGYRLYLLTLSFGIDEIPRTVDIESVARGAESGIFEVQFRLDGEAKVYEVARRIDSDELAVYSRFQP